MSQGTENQRVFSGMRPTGRMHFGHYYGALANWVQLQHRYECFFCVVDWHALTTHYDDTSDLEEKVWQMVIDWLAVGVQPGQAHIFIQSQVPEHAELALLLGMSTPLSWLTRVPTYKEQQEKLKERDLATYGFLGYPVLMAADVLLYQADRVPVGEDQLPHVELMREIARRFNNFYGREKDFEEKALQALSHLGKKPAKHYQSLRKAYQETGDLEALEVAQAFLQEQKQLTLSDKERLLGYLEGTGRMILPEPKALLTETPKLLGLDGQKMSKSYGNTIDLREDEKSLEKKLKAMQTDPARVRKTDPGTPEKCPVWSLHELYSDAEQKAWVQTGCQSAGIGCIECKKSLLNPMNEFLGPIRERAVTYENDLGLVKNIVAEGAEAARAVARETLSEVKDAMQMDYS